MKRFLPYVMFSSGLSHSTSYISFCDRSNLFAVLEWSVNCLSETCYFNLKYLLRKLSNETVLQNSNDFIGFS